MASDRDEPPAAPPSAPSGAPLVAAATEVGPESKALEASKRAEGELRSAAGFVYMTSPQHDTLAKLRTHPRFQHISRRRLARWKKADRWDERKTELLELSWQRAKERLATARAEALEAEYNALGEIAKLADIHLRDKSVLPKSWEGVAKIRRELGSERAKILKELGTELDPARVIDEDDVVMTDSEKQFIAQQLLNRRREELRRDLAAAKPTALIPASTAPDEAVPATAETPPVTPAALVPRIESASSDVSDDQPADDSDDRDD